MIGGLTRLALVFVLVTLASPVSAHYFGRNKVQYEDFDFSVMKTEHFDIYYYAREREAVEEAARLAERWYTRLSTILQHRLRGRQPLILYASHPDFEQTTAIPGFIEPLVAQSNLLYHFIRESDDFTPYAVGGLGILTGDADVEGVTPLVSDDTSTVFGWNFGGSPRPSTTWTEPALPSGGKSAPAASALAVLHRHAGNAAALAPAVGGTSLDVRASSRSPATAA